MDLAPDIIRAACASLHLGRVIESEALLYLQCALESPSFSQQQQHQHQAPLAATTIYLAVRMHQLPISVQCVVSAVGQQAKFSVKLFWKVAQAVHETPPAVDYNRFALLVMADVGHTKASPKLQVLSLYAKMMVWLEGADPTICVQTNTWTAAALQIAIHFYKINAPQSLLTTHFGIAAALLDQKVNIIQNLLAAAADRLHAGNTSWSEAIQTVLLSPLPASQDQHVHEPKSGKPVRLESMPPQTAAPSHAPTVSGATSLDTPSALTGNYKQLGSAMAGGADSSPSAVSASGTAGDGETTAGDVAATAAVEVAAAGDVASTAADAGATAAGHIATATDDDGNATARPGQVALGSDTSGPDKEAAACHLLPQATGFHVQTAPVDSQGNGKAQHDTAEQTEKSQAHPQQITGTADPSPATQPPPPNAPALAHHHNLASVLVHSSAASTQMTSAAPRSIGISAASSALLHGSQPRQLPLSPSHAAASVPGPVPLSYSQQFAPMHVTWQPQQQQQLPSQLLGPATRMLHSMLLQLERAGAQQSAMQVSEPLYPQPPTHRPPSFPSVLLQDPGLLDRVQSTLQGHALEGPQGPARAQSQARSALDAVDASQDASVHAEALLQADPVAAATRSAGMLGTNASPLSLLPGPLHAAIASAMGTAAAADVNMSHQAVSLAPPSRGQPAACKAGSPARLISEKNWKGTKRRRAESGSHDGMSSRAEAAAGPVDPSTGAPAATQAALKQQAVATTHRVFSNKATDSAAAPASGGFAAPCVVEETVRDVEKAVPISASSLSANKADPEALVSRLQAPEPEKTAGLEEGHAGGVNDKAADAAGIRFRRHKGFPSTQKHSRSVDTVSKCNPDEAVECTLASHSGLDSDDPSETRAITKRKCSDGVPAEQVTAVAQLAGGHGTCGDALHQTPERGNACDVTGARVLPTSTGLCTRERSAKDALLMLSMDQPASMSVPCEDGVQKQTAGLASGDDEICANRPPPFADVEGAFAYEVDKVVDKRYYKAGSQVRVQYLVRWKGYGSEDDTWQSRHSLRHARQAIQEFEAVVHV